LNRGPRESGPAADGRRWARSRRGPPHDPRR
jgi:hypothetical protein